MANYAPKDMIKDFSEAFSRMADTFMNKWGDYIGDSADVEALIENAFDNWVDESEWFEK